MSEGSRPGINPAKKCLVNPIDILNAKPVLRTEMMNELPFSLHITNKFGVFHLPDGLDGEQILENLVPRTRFELTEHACRILGANFRTPLESHFP
jgi:hypothetical protein